MSKEYTGNKTQEEIQAKVKNWDQTGWDRGEDWINFDFTSQAGDRYPVLYNGFNGTFLIDIGGDTITECSTELDEERWYIELLDILYKQKGE